MRHLLPALLAAACLLVAATDALACRMLVPRSGVLAERTVIMATVKHAERVDAPGWNTWRIVAEQTLDGPLSEDGPTFEFTVTLSSSGCGRTPLPPIGEQWVLYVDQADMNVVLHAFPLDYVATYDLRLAEAR